METMLYGRAHGKSWLQQQFRYNIDNRASPLDAMVDACAYGLGVHRVEYVPNNLYFMSPTGVHEVSDFKERPSRIVMTDQQMVERGLQYDAIRGGIVKFDAPPQVMRTTGIQGLRADYMIIDDPQNDAGERKGPKKVVKKDYNTIGVRFLRGDTLHKVYTYKVRKGAKVHLGQELVARTDRGDTVVVVVEIHKTPQDTGPYNYKFIDQKVAPL